MRVVSSSHCAVFLSSAWFWRENRTRHHNDAGFDSVHVDLHWKRTTLIRGRSTDKQVLPNSVTRGSGLSSSHVIHAENLPLRSPRARNAKLLKSVRVWFPGKNLPHVHARKRPWPQPRRVRWRHQRRRASESFPKVQQQYEVCPGESPSLVRLQ